MRKLCMFILLATCNVTWGQKHIAFVDSIRTAFNIPEISYAVFNHQSVFEIAAVGKHAIHLQDTATLSDRFHIGSNTKAMSAFMVAKYVDNGKLKWSTKFFEIFPEWKQYSNKAYHNITLQDLLSHRAHIQPFQGFDDPIIPTFKGNAQERRKAFGKFVLTLKPAVVDSSQPFIYSNAGYTLAALMLEKIANKSWEQLVKKVFNDDLKLYVKLSWPDNQTTKDTWGHMLDNDTLKPIPSNTNNNLELTEPAGDINIRLPDYIKFIQLNMAGLLGYNNYLKASTYQKLHKAADGYALGWYNIYENGKEWSTHSGTAFTYYTIAHIDRTKNISYVIFTNSFSTQTQLGVRLLMRKLKEDYKNQ